MSLPVSRMSFTTAYEPLSPTTQTRNRGPSPTRALQPPRLSPKPRPFSILSPKILTPLILWSLAIYLIHLYLLPLPFPTLVRRPKMAASDHHLSNVFPPPAERDGDDLDSVDPRWRPLQPLSPPDAPFPRLRPTRFLSPKCMEMWFMDGEVCGNLGEEDKLDATWLWVNGSDERWRDSMIDARVQAGIYSPEHHFREQNELVHSMRSVVDALPGKLRTFHLIVADYPFELPGDLSLLPSQLIPRIETSKGPLYQQFDEDGQPLSNVQPVSMELAERLRKHWRVAQTPTWLNFSHLEEPGYPTLRYATHSEIFHLPTLDRDGYTEGLREREWKDEAYRRKALPSFNSMAIESRIGWLPGLADVSISLNDDFFILRPHSVSDFHSPLYGSVIRFDHGYMSQVRPILDKAHFNDPGENGGLWHANWLLSRRYPRRLRPYFAHAPKVITRGLHHEASMMFAEALAGSSERKFREMSINDGDVQMQWLLTALRVERWREALLWTYVVANLGSLSPGEWSTDAREEIDYLFGLGEGDEDVIKIEVYRGERWTLESGRLDKVFEQAGWEAPQATEFLFSSLDGHLPPTLRPDQNPAENDKCVLDLEVCFGSFWSKRENVSAADMFKRLTFHHPECGDCLIMALVTASGPLGLSAFFPEKEATFKAPPGKTPKYLPPPHLPLTAMWQDADFSMGSVMSTTALPDESVNLRDYCMKLLSRYMYLSGKSVSHFHMLKSAEHAGRVFAMIQADPNVSILGLNDDIESDYNVVKMIMNGWFSFRWPKKAPWERE